VIKNKPFLFDSDSLKNFHKRIFFSVLVFTFCFSSAFCRITYISISSYFDNPLETIIKQNITRGNIYDRNGLVLAATVNSKSLYAEANKIKNIDIISKKLETILNINREIIQRKLSSRKNFIYIKRNITPLEHQKIIDLGEIHLKY
jgi:Cell division protein FtsI/penicillin-binding protein 2